MGVTALYQDAYHLIVREGSGIQSFADLAGHWVASQRPALSGALALIYGIALWTIWYWRGRRQPGDNPPVDLADVNFDSGDGHNLGD